MKTLDKEFLMTQIFSVLSSQFSVLSSQFSGSYSVSIAKSLPIHTPIFSKNSAVFAGFFCSRLRFFCYVKKSYANIFNGGLL
mgnify:CR=1 FL=1